MQNLAKWKNAVGIVKVAHIGQQGKLFFDEIANSFIEPVNNSLRGIYR
jgi:hypothetical protein